MAENTTERQEKVLMRGKRIGPTRYTARHLSAGRRKDRRSRHVCAKDLAFLKFTICGIFFVLIVALKLFLPETVESLARSASLLIGRDADFVEAFSAMGRAVSGEEPVEDSLKEAYSAVFNPSPMDMDEEQSEEVKNLNPSSAKALEYDTSSPASIKLALREMNEAMGESKTMETDSVSFFVQSLPENVSFEQRNLGFAYTTPILGALTSSFGWREHPVAGDSRFHYGLDLAAETGTDICAFADGQVYATGESSSLGKYIILSHAQGYRTLYAHCSSVLKLSGAVSMGEVIAKVGESGVATGPHLHFELQNGTLYLNPIYYVELG